MTSFKWVSYSESIDFEKEELFSCLKREEFMADSFAVSYTDGYVNRAMEQYDILLGCTESGTVLHSIITSDRFTFYMDYLKFVQDLF